MRDLDGKVAVVTGAASGIGAAMAYEFARCGMRVVVADIDEEAARTHAATMPDAFAHYVDVRNAASVDALRDAVIARFGEVHVLCNNAGIVHAAPILETTSGDWARVVGINLLGVVHGVLSFAPAMVTRGSGHIVNTASMAGFLTGNALASYDATKHAIVAFTENLYRELRESGVGVSLLAPAYVDTPLFDHASGNDSIRASFATTTKKWGKSAVDIAEVVVEAIEQNHFWVFTHDGALEMLGIKAAYARAAVAPDDPFRAPKPTEPDVAS